MQCSLGLVVVVLVSTACCVRAGDDCDPPAAGEKLTPPWECCETGDVQGFPEDLVKNIKKCKEKYPLPSDLPKGPPSAAIKSVMACAAECVFTENGFIAADKTVDKEAITKFFVKIVGGDKDWGSVVPKALEKCLTTYTAEVDKSLECKSGAKELEECVMRESFLACPKALWSDNAGCATLKAKVTKCPKVPIMLFKPKN